jgi:hypothetical protein
LAKNSWVGSTANSLKNLSDNTGFSLRPVPSHEQAKQNFKVALFFLWKILGYLQIFSLAYSYEGAGLYKRISDPTVF